MTSALVKHIVEKGGRYEATFWSKRRVDIQCFLHDSLVVDLTIIDGRAHPGADTGASVFERASERLRMDHSKKFEALVKEEERSINRLAIRQAENLELI